MTYKQGINRCVDVPADVSLALGGRGYTPVVATVKRCSARTTLVPRGGGQHRLFLDGAMRKAAGADAGSMVGIALRLDTASREIPVPRDLAAALARTKGARAAFNGFSKGLRREFLRWVLNAKHAETRERRIRRGIGVILKRSRAKRR